MDSRSNILIILTDQQRFDAVQSLGNAFNVPTPAIDSLVREGIVFDRCYCSAPVCSPSRSTLLTGLYPSQAGMPGNLYAPCPPLSPAQATSGKLMRAAGYETAYHGKWHLGGDVRDYGFEIGEECSHDETTRQLAGRFWRDRDWLEHERPFFHVVSFLDPHDLYFYDPNEPVEGFTRPWENAGCDRDSLPEIAANRWADWPESRWGSYHQFYAERIARVDRDIGLLLDDLRCSGFYNNTWIIFASDHGDMAGEHNLTFKGPFMYEGVTRVPMIVVPPRGRFLGDASRNVPVEELETGRTEHGLCSLIDVLPTVLDIAEAPAPENLPGKSLMPWVRQTATGDVHEAVFAEWHQPPLRMARTAEAKYVLYSDGAEELFDLVADPHETTNLAAKPDYADTKAALKARLYKHLEDTRDPFADLARHAFIFNPERGGYLKT